jgi:hypothetical protein
MEKRITYQRFRNTVFESGNEISKQTERSKVLRWKIIYNIKMRSLRKCVAKLYYLEFREIVDSAQSPLIRKDASTASN